jgi:hypothetical protein
MTTATVSPAQTNGTPPAAVPVAKPAEKTAPKPRAKKDKPAQAAAPSRRDAANRLAKLQADLLRADLAKALDLMPQLAEALASAADNPRCPWDRDAVTALKYLLTTLHLEFEAQAPAKGWSED